MRLKLLLATFASGLVLIPTQQADASCVPGFDYAAFGKDSFKIGGNGKTDSFNSAVNDYATAHNSTSGGNIGTNGTATPSGVLLGASTEIGGNIQYGPGCTSTCLSAGTATVDGVASALGSAVPLTSVTIPTIGTNQGNLTVAANIGITTNTWDTVTVNNGKTLTMAGGSYVFDNLTVKGTIVVTGPVVLYLKCSISSTGIDINAGGLINAAIPQKSTNFVIMAGPACTTANLRGGANTSFAFYGPDTNVNLNGGTEIFGSVVGKTVDDTGGVNLHYDLALSSFAAGGFACSPVEISRATPVVATLTGTDFVVQGTFEAPSGSPTTITNAASVAGFTFPYLKGHMRARQSSTLNVVADSFSSGTSLFDAGATGKIPTPINAGCAVLNGACRNIFTTTDAPPASGRLFHPAKVQLNDTNATAIGNLITAATGNVFTATDHQNIIHKILAGGLGGVDRSTVAVIGSSSVAGQSTRPTMTYFGAADGMLHAACTQVGGTTSSQANICPSAGTELWAFLPRVQLRAIASNTAKIDGSVRVIDAFGDFTNDPATGVKSWHTVLIFQTGYKQNALAAASYAIDVTDPAVPVVLWEYMTPTAPAAVDLGTGLAVAAGATIITGSRANLAVLETNNGGTGGAAVVANGVSIETGDKVWTTPFSYIYSTDTLRYLAADQSTLASGIPGGAVGVDLTTSGFTTDFVFGDIYGDLWRVNGANGTSRNGAGIPLFRFAVTKTPIGSLPAIFSNGSQQFAAFATGGYDDPIASGWAAATQYIIVAKLAGTGAAVTEATSASTSGPLLVNKTFANTGDKSFAQALIVGNQLFVTTDSLDVSNATYATASTALATGNLYTVDLTGTAATLSATATAPTVVFSGAGGIANGQSSSTEKTKLFASAGNDQQKVAAAAASATGNGVDFQNTSKMSRQIWVASR